MATERHLDQICMGLITIGGAVLAAVVLISGIAEERTEPISLITTVKYTGGALLAGVFAFMIVRVHRTLFPREVPEEERHNRKEKDAGGVMDVLGTMVLGLVVWVLILAFIPPDQPLFGDTSRSVRISGATWERLEKMVGPEGTPDEKISRLMETSWDPGETRGNERWKRCRQGEGGRE